MSWAPMQLIARPRGKLRPAGPFPRQHPNRTLGIKHPSSGRFNRPRTQSTGGMSYSKLPSGAGTLIRSLRVSRLANRQDIALHIAESGARARCRRSAVGHVQVGRLCRWRLVARSAFWWVGGICGCP
jgi:hypothetical protein